MAWPQRRVTSALSLRDIGQHQSLDCCSRTFMKGTASLALPSVVFVQAKKAAVPSGAMNSWSAAIFDTIAHGLDSHTKF